MSDSLLTRNSRQGNVQAAKGGDTLSRGGQKRGDDVLHADTGKETGSPYDFYGSMTEEVLHRYLDRAMQMNKLSLFWDPDYVIDGPEYGHNYDPYTNVQPLYNADYPHGKLLNMILDTGAKLIFDNAIISAAADDYWVKWMAKTLQNDCEYLHKYDPEIIVGMSLMEVPNQKYVNDELTLLLPGQDVINKFYNITTPYYNSGPRPLDPSLANQVYFDYRLMEVKYQVVTTTWQHEAHLDLNKPETLMWYYYIATKFIDAGCESIHFGDLYDGCRDDNGNRNLWYLAQQIREYASVHARRKMVLLDSHAWANHNNPFFYKYPNAWYFDPEPAQPLPAWERQLIFDFHSQGTYYTRNLHRYRECRDEEYSFSNSDLPVVLNYGMGMLNNSGGGLNPQGWHCPHNPSLCRYDLGGVLAGWGCHRLLNQDPSEIDCYMYDNTSWFARQRQDLKNDILRYTYYKIKCLDPYNHFAMPGRLIVRKVPTINSEIGYDALTEADVIKDIWTGVYAGPTGWNMHDFSLENLPNADVTPNSNLVFAGDKRMYFIGDDGYIHGYVYYSGTYNGGDWLTVSPTYSAAIYHGQNIQPQGGPQVRAAGDLVASPDGKMLLYRGVDGRLHGFEINDDWDYYYFDFTPGTWLQQSLSVAGALTFATNERIYYVAREADYSHHIHGFIKTANGWETVSPTHSAHYYFGQPPATQCQPAPNMLCRLLYDGNAGRLYYRGDNGYLYYYRVYDDQKYSYNEVDQHIFSIQQLTVTKDMILYNGHIFFIGYQPAWGHHVHEVYETATGWMTNSPSHLASGYNHQPIEWQLEAEKGLCISPDGNIIAYITKYDTVAYYKKKDGWYYSYEIMPVSLVENTNQIARTNNSLQFRGNTDLFFINRTLGGDVRHYKYEEFYCANPAIQAYENG